MQSNLSVNRVEPNFQAKVGKRFVNDAHNLMDFKLKNKNLRINFDEKVTEFENYGYDDYFIKYVKRDVDGKRMHTLIAVKGGMDDSQGVVLTAKDQFRKAIEKFTHINKYEFSKKMEASVKKQ